MLRVRSIPLERTVSLPDHYSFDSINPSIYKGYQLICTEKDAAKLWRMVPDAVAVALEMTLDAAFFHELDGRLSEILGAKLSSTHGHKIT
jgi:tetraacyldisaccharide 4'-kinase